MLVDGRAQCTGAVAMDQIDHGLAVQDGAVDEGIHLRQCLIDRQAQQIALHFGAALHPLYPAVRTVGVTGQAGIPLLRLGLGLRFLDQLFGLLQAQERNFGLDDSGANENIAVFIRQSQHRCQLIQLGDADLLPHLDLLQRNEFLDGLCTTSVPMKSFSDSFLAISRARWAFCWVLIRSSFWS